MSNKPTIELIHFTTAYICRGCSLRAVDPIYGNKEEVWLHLLEHAEKGDPVPKQMLLDMLEKSGEPEPKGLQALLKVTANHFLIDITYRPNVVRHNLSEEDLQLLRDFVGPFPKVELPDETKSG